MTRILAFVDNSVAARRVFEAAGALSPVFEATVDAVHVVEDGSASVTAIMADLGARLRVLHGEPIAEIIAASREPDVAAVVIGARDLPTASHPIGHVARALADAAIVPVLMVSPESSLRTPPGRVLVAMKGTPRQARRLRSVMHTAADANLEVVVIHVDDPATIPPFSDQVQHESEAYAREFLRRFAPELPNARLENRVGIPADEILRVARERHPDLLAVGWSSSELPDRGGVALAVLARSPVPVLLTPLAS
jgi:nucleotide-binding universal stress UspA family protein